MAWPSNTLRILFTISQSLLFGSLVGCGSESSQEEVAAACAQQLPSIADLCPAGTSPSLLAEVIGECDETNQLRSAQGEIDGRCLVSGTCQFACTPPSDKVLCEHGILSISSTEVVCFGGAICGDQQCDAGEVEACPQDCPEAVCSPNELCCDEFGRVQSTTFICQENVEREYRCSGNGGCGSSVGVVFRHRYCSGTTAACTGVLGPPTEWMAVEECGVDEYCVGGTAHCLPVEQQHEIRCANGAEQWHDSCGAWVGEARPCPLGCEEDHCLECVPEFEERCFGGDVYYYDSCGGMGTVAHECGDPGCLEDITLSPRKDHCRECTSQARLSCREGDLWWLDSCGIAEGSAPADNCNCGCENDQCTLCYQVFPSCPQYSMSAEYLCEQERNGVSYEVCGEVAVGSNHLTLIIRKPLGTHFQLGTSHVYEWADDGAATPCDPSTNLLVAESPYPWGSFVGFQFDDTYGVLLDYLPGERRGYCVTRDYNTSDDGCSGQVTVLYDR